MVREKHHMDRHKFATVVKTAVRQLPASFRAALLNIAITIDDRLGTARRSNRSLMGLYEGVPLPERSHDYAGLPPDKITLFRANIEAVCGSEMEMVEEIRKTLLHEIGHYFGLTERKLRALGY
ncbi:MAG: metallopeptidase family protein [Deltaproteobacteria bacterium]|nr:metallopeptidase family protein [Deltaproteobacteria bacterium]